MDNSDGTIAVTRGSRGPRLRLEGSIDLALSGEFYGAAKEVTDLPGSPAVDCRKLEHLSGAALQVLIAMAANLESRGRPLRLLAVSDRLRPTFEMAGLGAAISKEKNRKK